MGGGAIDDLEFDRARKLARRMRYHWFVIITNGLLCVANVVIAIALREPLNALVALISAGSVWYSFRRMSQERIQFLFQNDVKEQSQGGYINGMETDKTTKPRA